MNELDFSLILTCTIDPKGMKFLARSSIEDRLNDYKSSFTKWCNNNYVKRIIFIENSGYDLTFFNQIAQNFTSKEIEIISSDVNNNFPRELGKGYGEYLCYEEIFNKSSLAKKTNFFIKVTGRHYINNFSSLIDEIKNNKKDIHVCFKNNLTFVNTSFFAGSHNFFKNYILSQAKKTNDGKGKIIENCIAEAALIGIANGLTFNQLSTYANIDGYIGTNNKKIKNNFFKKIKLFFFGKLKKYFFNHIRY